MRPAVGVVVAVLVVVIAGCGNPLNSGEQTPATEDGLTVAAPGVTGDGVEDPYRLARAHEASLRNRSYTLRSVVTEQWPNGSMRSRIDSTLRVANGHDRYVFEQRTRGSFSGFRPPDRTMVWSDGNVTLLAIQQANSTAYSRYAMQLTLPIPTGSRSVVRYLQHEDDTHIRQITIDGWVAYHIETVDRLNASTSEDDIYVTAVVDSFGQIHRFNASLPAQYTEYSHVLSGRINTSLRYEELGRTTVRRPGWVDDAMRVTNSTAAT